MVAILGLWVFSGLPPKALGGELVFGGMISALFLSGPATVGLAFPLYFLLRGRAQATASKCSLFGGAIGVITAIIWSIILPGAPAGDVIQFALAFFICGAIGGLAFWWIAADEINRDLDLES